MNLKLVHSIEVSSVATIVAGKTNNRFALGTSLQQTIYTTSRFLLIPFFNNDGFLVESGILVEAYLKLVFCTFLLTFLFKFFFN